MPQTFHLPDTLADWKWERRINPHYPEVKAASSTWLRSFNAFSPKAQDAYDRCDFNLLAAMAYPLADKARLRTGCDMMNMFFIFDGYSDVAHETEVQIQADTIMDALHNPHKPRPTGEWVGGEVTRQFWELAIKTASAQSQKHFIEAFDDYTKSVVQQAADRSNCYVRPVDKYMEVRRYTIGLMPSLAILELDMDLADEVIHDPLIEKFTVLATDMIILGNDMHSYNYEQSRGDDKHGIVTTLMHHYNIDIDGAMVWIEARYETLKKDFMVSYGDLPKWGVKLDTDVQIYVEGMANWIRASDQWGFESERYFGTKGPEIQLSRRVVLLPRKRAEEVGPEVVDVSQI